MKRLVTACTALALLALFGSADAWAQVPVFNSGPSAYDGAPNIPVIFSFDSLEADSLFLGRYGDTPEDESDRAYLFWADWEGEAFEGDGSLLIDWGLFTDQDWGGSQALQHFLPDTTERLYDFSDFTHINLMYNVLVPADPAATFRLKLQDASEGLGTAPSSETEDWYSESGTLYQSQPGWNMISIPLEDLGTEFPGNTGFSRPGCPNSCWSGIWGNGELDLDMISGFQLEYTAGQLGAAADSSTAGTLVYDFMHVSGVRYDLIESFDDPGALGNWANSTAGDYSLVAIADTAEGTGAIDVTYNLVADQGWGGSVDIQGTAPGGGHFPNMSERTALSLFYKVIEPASDNANVNLTFKLFENSTGATEEWHLVTTEVLGDESGQWRRLILPFDDFAIPSWMGERGDEMLQLDQIFQFQVQIFGTEGTTTTGRILFDRLTSYGVVEVIDTEAPAAVEGLEVTASEFTNIVSWSDVPDEEGETYTIYHSAEPITDITAEGVMVAASGVEEGSEVLLHSLYAPVSDQDVTYYYAITAEDAHGNVSEVTALGTSVTNSAKGLATISLSPPAFVADGDLSEWSGITPIHVEPAGDLGHVPDAEGQTYVVNDAQDLSADVYLAIDGSALYVAFDITDDAHNPVQEGDTEERWLQDGTELYIGLYDWRGPKHVNFENTEEPDYKFYFYSTVAFRDGAEDAGFAPGSENYSYTETANGYVIEARLPFSAFAFDGAPAFLPRNGMRLPLDFVIMDNDLGGDSREGILTYSFDNQDNSWETPQNWFYTWIGDQFQVGVEDITEEVPDRYTLHQNYPNPFNPTTLITYDLPQAGRVTLKVFNVLGQEVHTLVDTEQSAGTYQVRFDATDLASGVYFYQIQTESFVQSKKMMLVR